MADYRDVSPHFQTDASTTEAHSTWPDRVALSLLLLGAFAVVLVSLPYKIFELDRFFVPKELVLHVTALLTALLCLGRARQLALTRVDTFLIGYVVLSAVSAIFAPNWWLALRALSISISGIVLFWVARSLAGAGLRRVLLAGLGAAVVVGATTALVQTYGSVGDYASLSRAPGGTFGNRNFMAHLCAIGIPTLLLTALGARRWFGFALSTLGIGITSAALFLSRSRAAWLAVVISGFLMTLTGWQLRHVWRDPRIGQRIRIVGVCAVAAVIAALLLPNRLNWKSDSPYLDSVTGVVNYKQGSGHGRIIQYRNSLHMARANPVLGVGTGNWAVRYPRFASRNDPSFDSSDMTANPWPSSDWVAIVSERGIPATLLLMLAFLGLVIGAWRQWGEVEPDERLVPLVLIASLAAVVVVGAFDAVLLLPIPALFAWSILGALAPPSSARMLVGSSRRTRRWIVLATIVVGGIFTLRSTSQAVAMALFDSAGTLRAFDRAALVDPGSYRIHIRVAELYLRRGSCAKATTQATQASALFPNAPAPRRVLRACGVSAR